MSLLAASCGDSPTVPKIVPTALTLTCPANMETSTTGAPAPISYITPVPTGGTAPFSVACTPGSNTMFPVGSTPVTCTATDARAQFASCSFNVTVVARPTLTQTRFLAFGDSLTEGKLSSSLNVLIESPAHSYPAKLRGLLLERYTDQPITVLNEGFGGERATESFARYAEALSRHAPQSVLLMHGVNDLNGTEDGRVQAVVDTLDDHVRKALSRGITPFVASLPPVGPPKGACPECVEPLNQRLRAMAAARGAVFVDVHGAWGNRPGLFGADGIHPTPAGYDVIAGAFFEAIRKKLESPIP